MNLQLASIHIKDSPLAMPLAVAMLKASLDDTKAERPSLQVDLADFHLGHTATQIADGILSTNADFVGFSVYLWNRNLTVEVAGILKEKSKMVLFAGGADVTADPTRMLDTGLFDFVVKGEAELIIKEIMDRLLEQKPVLGIESVYIKDMEQSPALARPLMKIDEFVSPFLSGTIDFSNYKGMLWELSRGCIFKCTFCFEGRGIEGVRRFSIPRLREELLLFEENDVTQVWVLDPTFNQQRDRAKELLRMIYETAPNIHFTFEVRTEFLDAEMAGQFAELNCSLQIGLQSANIEVLKNIKRHFKPERYSEKIRLLNEAGAIFGLDLIYGLPGDTITGFKASLDYAVSLQPNNLDIFPLAVLPGTELADDAAGFELVYRPEAPYTLIRSPSYTEADMAHATELTRAFNIFYNKGAAVGWLFIILETLELNASDFFERFLSFLNTINADLEPESYTYEQILNFVLEFTGLLFAEFEKTNLFMAMSDVINYNSYIAQSLTAKSTFPEHSGESVKLADSTFLVPLNYLFEDLMCIGEYNLSEFIENFSGIDSRLLIYNNNGSVESQDIDLDVYEFFSQITEAKSVNELTQEQTNTETRELLEEALEQNIIQYV